MRRPLARARDPNETKIRSPGHASAFRRGADQLLGAGEMIDDPRVEQLAWAALIRIVADIFHEDTCFAGQLFLDDERGFGNGFA